MLRMGSVQIKHVDDETHDLLRQRAAEHGQTLSEYLLELIRRDLRTPPRREWLDRALALRSTGRTSDENLAIRDAGRGE